MDVMGWCYVVILIEFCLDPLFSCCGLILMIAILTTELLLH
jgi:hypothetical protein